MENKIKVGITGHHGYVGQHFIQHAETCFDFMLLDFRKPVSELNLNGIECLIHLAAIVHQPKVSVKELFEVNVNKTNTLMEAAHKAGVKHIIFVSSVAVYGINGFLSDFEKKILDETSAVRPMTPYGHSKWLAELNLTALRPPCFTIIRSPMVYGQNAPGNMTKLCWLIQKTTILPFKDCNNKRSLICIDNLCEFLKQVILHRISGILIPQDAEQPTMERVIKTIANAYQKKVFLFKMPKIVLFLLKKIKKSHAESLFGELIFDSSKTDSRMPDYHVTTFDEAIKKMIAKGV